MQSDYSFRDVFLGMVNFMPGPEVEYNYDYLSFSQFFYDRRDNYSVLDKLAFDIDGNFPESNEIFEGYNSLMHAPGINKKVGEKAHFLNKGPFKITFHKFVRQNFDVKEVEEIKKLSLDFQENFF